MFRTALRLTSPLLLSLLLVEAASAQEASRVSPYAGGTLTLGDENDMFGGTDRYYTNGLMLHWTSPATTPAGPVAWLDRSFSWLLGPGEFRWGLSLEQSIFTPEEIRRHVPDPTDRPYAGHLFGSLNLERETAATRTSLSFQLGVVGAASGGEFTQNRWHDVINKYHAEGWDYQLRDEVTFGVVAERQWRMPTGRIAGLDTEVLPVANLALGTAYTYAGAGGLVRIGTALGADWGPARIRPAISSSPLQRPQHDFGWYIFGGAGGRAVARNLFLDGSTYRESASVDRKWFVGEAQVGAAILWRGTRLAYTHVWQSSEFDGQRGGQAFGSISLTVPF
ncbi:lipid A deacylase LpxR family protein [Pararoseomonas indoligenes]|uniref:Lipid A deacylase LpxR family protein n=1 Tax=Roseomonas indoligenes TaxID=2820811 RepID=A0A940S4L0_9PROT|nr:lipid A deacylase LpxR family protein [Pararoseomonas indoligenes]MBP0492085.1 lipid A deacylase LpxR family protein [Pararoseomonas indoligenes]